MHNLQVTSQNIRTGFKAEFRIKKYFNTELKVYYPATRLVYILICLVVIYSCLVNQYAYMLLFWSHGMPLWDQFLLITIISLFIYFVVIPY